jgi:hypothetical protein
MRVSQGGGNAPRVSGKPAEELLRSIDKLLSYAAK